MLAPSVPRAAQVSDGIVAPGYEPAALAILSAKKGGAFIVLEAAPGFTPPPVEFREVYGMAFAQRRNDTAVAPELVTRHVVTPAHAFTPEAVRDCVVAMIAIKYTQVRGASRVGGPGVAPEARAARGRRHKWCAR